VDNLWARSVTLQILGSGGPNDISGRASSGYLVWIDEESKITRIQIPSASQVRLLTQPYDIKFGAGSLLINEAAGDKVTGAFCVSVAL
jgi:hypothetical protein